MAHVLVPDLRFPAPLEWRKPVGDFTLEERAGENFGLFFRGVGCWGFAGLVGLPGSTYLMQSKNWATRIAVFPAPSVDFAKLWQITARPTRVALWQMKYVSFS
jgi:hypothetical protein